MIPWGDRCDFEGLQKAFSAEELVEAILFGSELNYMARDAMCAIEKRDVAGVTIHDFAGASMADLLQILEYGHVIGEALQDIHPQAADVSYSIATGAKRKRTGDSQREIVPIGLALVPHALSWIRASISSLPFRRS